MTFKKGDKVEYCGGIWVFKEYDDREKEFSHINYGEINLLVFTTKIKPIKSAHDKLIEMGYVVIDDCKAIKVFSKNGSNITFDKIYNSYFMTDEKNENVKYIDLELVKGLVQYLEEMEDTK